MRIVRYGVIEALQRCGPFPKATCARSRSRSLILEGRDGNGGNADEFEEAREGFSECINRWQQKSGERDKTDLRRWMKNAGITSNGLNDSSSTGLFWSSRTETMLR